MRYSGTKVVVVPLSGLLAWSVCGTPEQAAIRMAETIVTETALKVGQAPGRYNRWMYQNHMIGKGIGELGEILDRPEAMASMRSEPTCSRPLEY